MTVEDIETVSIETNNAQELVHQLLADKATLEYSFSEDTPVTLVGDNKVCDLPVTELIGHLIGLTNIQAQTVMNLTKDHDHYKARAEERKESLEKQKILRRLSTDVVAEWWVLEEASSLNPYPVVVPRDSVVDVGPPAAAYQSKFKYKFYRVICSFDAKGHLRPVLKHGFKGANTEYSNGSEIIQVTPSRLGTVFRKGNQVVQMAERVKPMYGGETDPYTFADFDVPFGRGAGSSGKPLPNYSKIFSDEKPYGTRVMPEVYLKESVGGLTAATPTKLKHDGKECEFYKLRGEAWPVARSFDLTQKKLASLLEGAVSFSSKLASHKLYLRGGFPSPRMDWNLYPIKWEEVYKFQDRKRAWLAQVACKRLSGETVEKMHGDIFGK